MLQVVPCFFKALRLSKGTVSILDKGGVVFTRVWCSFEIYVSLVGSKPGFLWDVYTAIDAVGTGTPAVGITDGLAKCDRDQPINKGKRESKFPSKLARSALGIELEKAQASMDEDRRRSLDTLLSVLGILAVLTVLALLTVPCFTYCTLLYLLYLALLTVPCFTYCTLLYLLCLLYPQAHPQQDGQPEMLRRPA